MWAKRTSGDAEASSTEQLAGGTFCNAPPSVQVQWGEVGKEAGSGNRDGQPGRSPDTARAFIFSSAFYVPAPQSLERGATSGAVYIVPVRTDAPINGRPFWKK